MNIFNQPFFIKLIKFSVVGATGVCVDFIITYIFKEIFKVQKYVSSSIGFVISAIVNFTLNRIWTFQNHDPNWAFQFFKFFAVALVGLAISLIITYLLNEKIKLNFYLAKALSIGGAMIWNFLVNNYYTFS